MVGGLDNYASPILRAAVFRQLNPDAYITYRVVTMEEAFPEGFREYEGKATHAIHCQIIWPDGHFVDAYKEIDVVDNRNRRIAMTPEELAKNETKALGRAMRDCGIPQRLTELKMLMSWLATMNGRPAATLPPGSTVVADEFNDEGGGEIDDPADAGAEETQAQALATRFSRLSGKSKAEVAKHARDVFGVANVMRADEESAIKLLAFIDTMHSEGGEDEEPEERF